MKIAITGKGGVGKTTLAGTLAHIYAENGYKVLAIDADPDANLASALGLEEKAQKITPISEMEELIRERTGAEPGSLGGFFKLNPRVDDLPDKLWVGTNGIKLLVMGTVKKGGSGCICPESALIRSLLQHIFLSRKEVVIMDMEAGVEHLGRATAQGMDAFIVVVEPGKRSLRTAETIKKLAQEIGISNIFVVINKIYKLPQKKALEDSLSPFDILGSLSYSEALQEADFRGEPPFDADKHFLEEVRKIEQKLTSFTS